MRSALLLTILFGALPFMFLLGFIADVCLAVVRRVGRPDRRFWIAPALLVAMLTGTASAGDYAWNDGYYWRDGLAYSRYQSTYWDGCCWKASYNYRPVDFVNAYRSKLSAAYSHDPVDVSGELLAIAKLKVEYDHKLAERKQAADELQKGLESLGLKAPAVATYSTSYGAQSLTSGTTVYGYPSVNNVAGLYGDGVNLQANIQTLLRTGDNMLKLAEKVNDGNQQAIKDVSAGRDRAALLLAAAQLVSASPGIQTTTTSGAQQSTTIPAAINLDSILTTRCASCHNAEKLSGKSDLFPDGVNLSKWREFDAEQWKATVVSVAEGTMPKNATVPLSLSETREFFNARALE